MSRGDRTEPMGMGPMTGRGAGYCAGYATAGYAKSAGFGCSFGRGRGFRRMFYATGLPCWLRYGGQNVSGAYFAAAGDEKEFLKRQAEFLENQLDNIKKRLEEIEE